jgi:pyruvate dehydrogenase E2 component (dihydrolipoamide acetyltransferase)
MASEVTIPRLGWNMDEGIFVGWLKADGEPIKAGEPLFNLEGDKATQEIESLEAGILRILPDGPKDGEKVAVGVVIGYLVAPGEPAPFELKSAAEPPLAPSQSIVNERAKHHVSPRARRTARELGVDPTTVTGSGRTGRIVERDIRAAAGRHPARPSRAASARERGPELPREGASPEYRELAISSVRKTIAQRMVESRQTTAAVTITTTVDATNLVNLRRQFKAVVETGEAPAIGYTEIIVKLSALAIEKHPMLNSRWAGDQIQISRNVHIGIAVDTDSGLKVPVIRDVPHLSLRELAARSRSLAERARNETLTAAELSGSTFTVSNLGQLGVEIFTPLINPPECAILGLGRIQSVVAVEDRQFVERDRMFLSLTFDHRIVDGAPAARFLQALGRLIENPSPWLLP